MERFAGRYVLLRRLGQGGMGAVYLALDLSTSTQCALKRLDPQMVRVAPDSLRREFELLSRVRHPAVVAVNELGFAPDGSPFYTMEYVAGVSLDQAVMPGDWTALCDLAAQVTHGLEALHGAGVIHGDLKPSNLLALPGAEMGGPIAGVRLLDFGLAALLGRDHDRHRGTPGYAAPEIARGEAPSVASDLYGLGATLHALAAGRPAFARPATGSVVTRASSGTPSAMRLEEAGAPAPLIELILRLLAPSRGERPSDAREVRAELERIEPRVRRSLARRLQTERVVGRDRELARLERLLERDDAARVTMLTGDAGVGKSALLGELAVRASLAGRPVLRFSCAALAAPGALATALLRRLAVDAHAANDGTDRSRRALELVDGAERIGEGADMSLLADAAAAWGHAIEARGMAAAVLLDDWEAVDPLSRAFVRRVALHPDGGSIRWVWAGRAGEHGLLEDDRVLLDAGQARRLALGALDAAGAERLLAARLHQNPPPELATFLWAHADGHPGLNVEYLRVAAERGALQESEIGLTVDAARLAALALPADFERSLLARLAALPAPARALAAALAVWQRAALPAELRVLAPDAGPDALAHLLDAGLASQDAAGRVALSPPGLAPQLAASLDDAERRRLHRAALGNAELTDAERFVHLRGTGDAGAALVAAARALEQHADERLAIEAAALADTAAPEQAAAWQERAGRMLLERGRQRDAVPYLERALAAEPEGPARPERWYLLSRAMLRAARPEEVGAVIARALAEHPPPHVRSRLLHNESSRLISQGQLDAARTIAEEALAIARDVRDDEAIGLAALTLGSALHLFGDHAETRSMARLAEETLARARNGLGRTRALGLHARAAAAEQQLAESERMYDEGLDTARREGLRLATEELLVGRAMMLVETGRWAEARDAHAEAARIALEDGRPRGTALALANLAQDDGLTGRPARARRQARAAIRLTRAYLPRQEALAWRSFAQACRISGRTRRAERAARRALDLAYQRGVEGELDWCRIEYGRLCIAGGRWKEAEEVWSHAALAAGPRGSVAATILAALLGRAALRRRDLATASSRLALCKTWLSTRTAPYAAAHAAQLEAELALAQGEFESGTECATAALAAFGALPAPADRAAAALEFARIAMAAGAGPRTPVEEWLEDAAGLFERLGDHGRRERTLALTVEWMRRQRVAASSPASGRGLIESVSRLLDSLADMRELTQRAMALAVEQLDAERGVLLLADAQTGNLVSVVEHGAIDAATRDRAMSYSRQAVERVARSGGSLLIQDAPSDAEAMSDSVADLGLRSIVCVPLYVSGKVVGAVYLDDSRRPEAFSDADRALLEGFAHLMAVAIEKSRGQEEVHRVNELLVGENLSLRREVGVRFQPKNFIGMSSAMQQVLSVVERAAQTSTTVLLTGENGTGKELVARILHHSGKRRLGAFVSVNCGAIPATLLESELFGILPNVATGVRGRDGRFHLADGGTLFLDEVGDMPLLQQVALLSAIANREITPVGGGPPVAVDVRIIAATNRDLRRLVDEGAFREDLYYRLNVIPIEIPPLRERKADIPALARHFAAHFAEQQEREVPELSAEFLASLMQSDWPGNVRELQNYVERVMAMTSGVVLVPLPQLDKTAPQAPKARFERGRRLTEMVSELERRLVRDALERCDGNQSRAARELGLTEQSLRYRIQKYGMGTRKSLRVREKRR